MSETNKEADNPDQPLQQAQLEQLQLQNQKLKRERADAGKQKPWRHTLLQMVPLITASVTLVGFLWGVIQYRDQQVQNRDAQKKLSEQEAETAQREFMKPWLESQCEIYLEDLSAATIAANSDDPAKRREATEQFWQLYQGKMILVETKSVSGAMVHFGRCLAGTDT